jgi:hypothetical protein
MIAFVVVAWLQWRTLRTVDAAALDCRFGRAGSVGL